MAISYSWVISQLDCYPEHEGRADVVFIVHWRRQADDGDGHTGDVFGMLPLVLDPAAPFTPYAELTFSQICGWVEDTLGAAQIAQLDANLDRQIANQINPPVVVPPLPWA